ncbi:MAG TPA: crossover junction endodeoxyribonuclease RuvC [Actinomycetota bacterium]|nr:crossover junction endodeoxyribonuclease RuvC [Actinomycetota bacterium]
MFERVVVGVDPGTAATGVAVVGERRGAPPAIVSAETVRTRPGSPEPHRLRTVYLAVREALAGHHPSGLAVEKLIWGKNAGSAMGVARATGVILLAAAEAGIPAHEYAPLEVKLAVTGNGTAAKEEVRRMLERVLRIDGVPSQPDAADAVAVAVCHLAQSRFVEAVR